MDCFATSSLAMTVREVFNFPFLLFSNFQLSFNYVFQKTHEVTLQTLQAVQYEEDVPSF